ncbi:MAG TPA: fimbrial protein [Luteibacter sp.]|uniref:fimbrial protein n=1 Tax=Luteibacter sp. TaxID=1886636 RepID=UPI002B5C27C7|nr:fimbrial protein [Luteibacter sp.]HVI56691.1 fimbrial protein [Luteibacter sp.]
MNLKATLSALLIAGAAAPSAFASAGTITFDGEITNVSCSVSGEGGVGPNFTVNLAGVDASKFTGIGTRVGETGFRIYIGKPGETNCTDTTKVWASFDPDSALVDSTTGMVKVTSGTATGVQFRLMNENQELIDIWGDQKPIKKDIVNNQAVLAHVVAFEQTGATVAPGKATGSVKYTIRFEP